MPTQFLPLLLLLTVACSPNHTPKDPWFLIEKNGRYGFIDSTGHEVIPPRFRALGEFADSLCPARLHGTWGYIDRRGEWTILPQYDYAQNFSEGLACVWRSGQAAFVDRRGQVRLQLPDSTTHVADFQEGVAFFLQIKNGKKTQQNLHTDGQVTPDSDPLVYSEGLTVVTRDVPGEQTPRTEYAVRDSAGRTVIPFGRFSDIEPFHQGRAEASFRKEETERSVFIDCSGKVIFALPPEAYVYENYFSEGLVAANVPFEPGSNMFGSDTHYLIWFDTTGRQVWVRKEDRSATPFQNGRSFVTTIDGYHYLMDKNGRHVGPNRFDGFSDTDFSDNAAIVSDTNHLYGVIDSMGQYTIPPRFDAVGETGFQREGLLAAFWYPGASGTSESQKRWGLIDRQGRWIFQPQFTEISPNGFQNGLLYAELDSLYGYVDPRGQWVWNAVRQRPDTLEYVNSDVMLRAYCYAQSSESTREDGYGARAQPDARAHGFEGQGLGLWVNNAEADTFQHICHGVAAYLFNTGSDTLGFPTQDNRLYLLVQALDERGQWRDIEYSPSSWCGNSYYDVQLYPDQYWRFVLPAYEGDYPVQLRLALTRGDRWDKNKQQVTYSNTFPGRLNPGQFWRKQGHLPGNLMDPYFD